MINDVKINIKCDALNRRLMEREALKPQTTDRFIGFARRFQQNMTNSQISEL